MYMVYATIVALILNECVINASFQECLMKMNLCLLIGLANILYTCSLQVKTNNLQFLASHFDSFESAKSEQPSYRLSKKKSLLQVSRAESIYNPRRHFNYGTITNVQLNSQEKIRLSSTGTYSNSGSDGNNKNNSTPTNITTGFLVQYFYEEATSGDIDAACSDTFGYYAISLGTCIYQSDSNNSSNSYYSVFIIDEPIVGDGSTDVDGIHVNEKVYSESDCSESHLKGSYYIVYNTVCLYGYLYRYSVSLPSNIQSGLLVTEYSSDNCTHSKIVTALFEPEDMCYKPQKSSLGYARSTCSSGKALVTYYSDSDCLIDTGSKALVNATGQCLESTKLTIGYEDVYQLSGNLTAVCISSSPVSLPTASPGTAFSPVVGGYLTTYSYQDSTTGNSSCVGPDIFYSYAMDVCFGPVDNLGYYKILSAATSSGGYTGLLLLTEYTYATSRCKDGDLLSEIVYGEIPLQTCERSSGEYITFTATLPVASGELTSYYYNSSCSGTAPQYFYQSPQFCMPAMSGAAEGYRKQCYGTTETYSNYTDSKCASVAAYTVSRTLSSACEYNGDMYQRVTCDSSTYSLSPVNSTSKPAEGGGSGSHTNDSAVGAAVGVTLAIIFASGMLVLYLRYQRSLKAIQDAQSVATLIEARSSNNVAMNPLNEEFSSYKPPVASTGPATVPTDKSHVGV